MKEPFFFSFFSPGLFSPCVIVVASPLQITAARRFSNARKLERAPDDDVTTNHTYKIFVCVGRQNGSRELEKFVLLPVIILIRVRFSVNIDRA